MDNPLRRLPWTGPDGQPAYLATDDAQSFLAQLADNIESVQMSTAGELLCHARELLANRHASSAELRFTLTRLSEALSDVLRVAESRGARCGADESAGDLS